MCIMVRVLHKVVGHIVDCNQNRMGLRTEPSRAPVRMGENSSWGMPGCITRDCMPWYKSRTLAHSRPEMPLWIIFSKITAWSVEG